MQPGGCFDSRILIFVFSLAVGRSVASYGRKEHVQENKRRQLILDDNDGDDVYYSLPTSS